jgi:hypothetical protein
MLRADNVSDFTSVNGQEWLSPLPGVGFARVIGPGALLKGCQATVAIRWRDPKQPAFLGGYIDFGPRVKLFFRPWGHDPQV